MTMGRPTDYSEELIETICTRLSEGESLKKICDSDGMPTRTTVFSWLQRYPEFSDKYRQARLWQADTHADEIVDIADSARDRDDTPAKKLQAMFVMEYLIDLNATQAAIRAGYAPRSASTEGARLLANDKVQAHILLPVLNVDLSGVMNEG